MHAWLISRNIGLVKLVYQIRMDYPIVKHPTAGVLLPPSNRLICDRWFNLIHSRCRYNAVQYNMILDTSFWWMAYNINQNLNHQNTSHSSPDRARYRVSFMKILEKINRVIVAPHCTLCAWDSRWCCDRDHSWLLQPMLNVRWYLPHTFVKLLGGRDDVIKWKHSPRSWPFVRGTTGHRWIPVRPVMRNFDISFDLCLNKRLSKQSKRGDLTRHRVHYEVTVMF